MNNGKERFKEELWAQTDPRAKEELNRELNEMGKMPDVVRESENQEMGDFVRETKESDARAGANREQAAHENALYGLVLDAIQDITNRGGVKGSRPIGAFLEDLEDRNEAMAVADHADPASRFHGHPKRVSEFGAGIKKLIDSGAVSPDMSFARVSEVLEQKSLENNETVDRAGELERRDAFRREREQLMDICRFIQGAPRDLVKKYRAKRIKRLSTAPTSTIPSKDTLWIAIECNPDAIVFLSNKFDTVSKRIITKERNGLTFEAPFQRRFLDEAQKSFKWIKSE